MVTRPTRPAAQLRTCLEGGFLMTELRTCTFPASLPTGSRRAGNVLNLGLGTLLVFWFCIAAVTAAPAQSVLFTSLVSFDETDGSYPAFMALVNGADGNIYGTTTSGGTGSDCVSPYICGTVFKVTSGGTLTTLYNFCSQQNCTDGDTPLGGLAPGTDGNFYGTTSTGGGRFIGTVFKITPAGGLTTLHTFQGYPDDGGNPSAGLFLGSDGDFYGTTESGGANTFGSVFKITSSGVETLLYSFQGYPTDGASPDAGLVQGSDGNFYGTTTSGGSDNDGIIFKITPSGALTILHSFPAFRGDGYHSVAGLVQGEDGNFYGTTQYGGANDDGIVFKITPNGALTVLYSFCAQASCADGSQPTAPLVQGGDGNFYGTASTGGSSTNCFGFGCGTVFKITPQGTLTTLHSFNNTDGDEPEGGLVQAPDGFLYGTTNEGGTSDNCGANCGTVFRLLPVRECATCRQ
jgi:uncharacterized repeat protein (TIGR03803 family)